MSARPTRQDKQAARLSKKTRAVKIKDIALKPSEQLFVSKEEGSVIEKVIKKATKKTVKK